MEGGQRGARQRALAGEHELRADQFEKDEVGQVRAGGAPPPTPPEPKEAFQHIICFLVLMCLLL